jgi:hypothetical protein
VVMVEKMSANCWRAALWMSAVGGSGAAHGEGTPMGGYATLV